MESTNFRPFLNQNYEQIKAECIKSKKLFEDDQFPANNASLYKFNPPKTPITWKRPNEFLNGQQPMFIVNSIETNDIDQGQLEILSFKKKLSYFSKK